MQKKHHQVNKNQSTRDTGSRFGTPKQAINIIDDIELEFTHDTRIRYWECFSCNVQCGERNLCPLCLHIMTAVYT